MDYAVIFSTVCATSYLLKKTQCFVQIREHRLPQKLAERNIVKLLNCMAQRKTVRMAHVREKV